MKNTFFIASIIFCSFIIIGCSLPTYKAKGPLTIPIEIRVIDGVGFVEIKKLSSNCKEESRIKTSGVGRNHHSISQHIYVDAIEKFSFQLVYQAPNFPTCKVQDTISLKYGDTYRILLNTLPPNSPNRQSCNIKLEINPYTKGKFQGMGDWIQSDFEGSCSTR